MAVQATDTELRNELNRVFIEGDWTTDELAKARLEGIEAALRWAIEPAHHEAPTEVVARARKAKAQGTPAE